MPPRPDQRRDAGVVERGGLENRCGGNSTQGSNPCLSATFLGLYRHPQPWFWIAEQRLVRPRIL